MHKLNNILARWNQNELFPLAEFNMAFWYIKKSCLFSYKIKYMIDNTKLNCDELDQSNSIIFSLFSPLVEFIPSSTNFQGLEEKKRFLRDVLRNSLQTTKCVRLDLKKKSLKYFHLQRKF